MKAKDVEEAVIPFSCTTCGEEFFMYVPTEGLKGKQNWEGAKPRLCRGCTKRCATCGDTRDCYCDGEPEEVQR